MTVAINPPSDIVLDVARAADPERYQAALERLTQLRATPPANEAFASLAADPGGSTPATADAPKTMTGGPVDAAAHGATRSQLNAYGKFEAFVLQSFLDTMLPKNATAVFGTGSAGEFWRSMLAEKLGEELARSGQVGIAQRLDRAHQAAQSIPADTPAGSVTRSPGPSTVHAIPQASAQLSPAAPDAFAERS